MYPSKDDSRHLTRLQAWSLYLVHFLFSWNVRSYEFSAIIFTASIYPNTLTAASIRGVSTTVAAICFSSFIGRWIDCSPSRLRSLSLTIWVHRSAVLIAYFFWLFLVDDAQEGRARHHVADDSVHASNSTIGSSYPIPPNSDTSPILKNIIFAIILVLGVLVRLSTIANDISIDREWLPVLAPSSASSTSTTSQYDLTHLNAVMRRIDLICKVLTPLLITTFVSLVQSYRICIVSVSFLTIVSWVAELWCARWIYRSSSALRTPKPMTEEGTKESLADAGDNPASQVRRLWHGSQTLAVDQVKSLKQYFSTSVWIPATALALLHLTVLAYSASLITYLLEIGFSLTLITTARATGSIVEVGSTVLTPWAVHYFSRKHVKHEMDGDEAEAEGFLVQGKTQRQHIDSTVLEKVGLWGISWQFCNLIPVVVALFLLSSRSYATASTNEAPVPIFTSICLLLFLSLSRAGLWAYDLTTQELTQTLVPAAHLSSFAGTQESFQSMFELTHWLITAGWGNPRQFRWLALGSLGAVGTSAGCYAMWVRTGDTSTGDARRKAVEWVEEPDPQSPRVVDNE